jgi:predicted RNA methylase
MWDSRAGEILFNGVSRIMDPQHLDSGAPGTRTLYDLGSGCGRLCVQVFLQFTNLDKVVGVEVSSCELAAAATRG